MEMEKRKLEEVECLRNSTNCLSERLPFFLGKFIVLMLVMDMLIIAKDANEF